MGTALDEIRHVVILMLENRSFDHLLGALGPDFAPQAFDGLRPGEAIPADPAHPERDLVSADVIDDPSIRTTSPDPGHEFEDVQVQLYGRRAPPPGAPPSNTGFIASYAEQPPGAPIGDPAGRAIMRCVGPGEIPVLRKLARSFVVCDRWFSSVPGPTWPNRFFLHAATSGGHAENPSAGGIIRSQLWLSPYRMRTIYENLMEASPPRTWKIYLHDVSQAFALKALHPYVADPERFGRFDDPLHPPSFSDDVAQGRLASYTFIEPQYFAGASAANDQHPPHDLREGERLVAAVYDTLRDAPHVWPHCLLVVLWDEHGGFFDHVPPPAASPPEPPDGLVDREHRFRFDRLGVRVPAILVSPWVPRGLVDHTVYDHTSVLATVKKLFHLPHFLTLRDACACTFDHNFMDAPRGEDDAPRNLSALVGAGAPGAAPAAPPSSHERSLAALGDALTAEGIQAP